MIQLQNVSFAYNHKAVLKNLTTVFEASKCHVILGPSGSGKSTLLKLLAGLLNPTSGEISVPGSYGYVLQEGGLFSHLTVLDNISIQGQMKAWPQERISQRVRELCQLTQFPDQLLSRFPGEISGGQRQRVSIMRALFAEPNFLLLDESLSALDPLLKYELMHDLRAILISLKKTTVMVTHDLKEASVLGDHILLLEDGRICESAEKSVFFNSPKTDFAKKYIQSQLVGE